MLCIILFSFKKQKVFNDSYPIIRTMAGNEGMTGNTGVSAWIFIFIGLIVSGFSFWMNYYTNTSKLLVFAIIGTVMLLWGLLKLLIERRKNATSRHSAKIKMQKSQSAAAAKGKALYGNCPICGARLFYGARRCSTCATPFNPPFGMR